MELLNTTRLAVDMTTGTSPDGRESLVVVAKGTFAIGNGRRLDSMLAEVQEPLAMTDIYAGDAGSSAPLYEMDFAPRKPRCDVLLTGRAYAPGGRPTTRVHVSLQVGTMRKAFDVVGDRVWRAGVTHISFTRPAPFVVMPVAYSRAFGGVDRASSDPSKHRWCLANHSGVGYHEDMSGEAINGQPLPNTEEAGQPVRRPDGDYRPMAFGPVARAWQPRPKWAGTYDQKWREEKAPFLPDDFDYRYFQAAPDDQQIDYPHGGESVELVNLSPEGRITFNLPERLDLNIVFAMKDDVVHGVPAVVDTIYLEPDEHRFVLVWRASMPLRRSLFEVKEVAVGMTVDRWRRRELRKSSGKTWFRSLAEMVDEKREGLLGRRPKTKDSTESR